MDTQQERLSHLDSALLSKQQICSSEGMLYSFPPALQSPFLIEGVGLVICRQGNFTFILNQNHSPPKPAIRSSFRKIPCFKYCMHPVTWKYSSLFIKLTPYGISWEIR